MYTIHKYKKGRLSEVFPEVNLKTIDDVYTYLGYWFETLRADVSAQFLVVNNEDSIIQILGKSDVSK